MRRRTPRWVIKSRMFNVAVIPLMLTVTVNILLISEIITAPEYIHALAWGAWIGSIIGGLIIVWEWF